MNSDLLLSAETLAQLRAAVEDANTSVEAGNRCRVPPGVAMKDAGLQLKIAIAILDAIVPHPEPLNRVAETDLTLRATGGRS